MCLVAGRYCVLIRKHMILSVVTKYRVVALCFSFLSVELL